MKIYFYIEDLSNSFLGKTKWEFDFPVNTKLSELLNYLSLNTNLGNEINKAWEIKENLLNNKKSLGFILIDSKKRIRTVLNDFSKDLPISEIPSNLKAVIGNKEKYLTFTFGTEEYIQMLDFLRQDSTRFKVKTPDLRFLDNDVFWEKVDIGDFRYIYVIGILNHSQNDVFFSFGQISSLDYDYLCKNDDLPLDTYIKYAKKRPLYSENNEKNYFTEEDLSRFMIYTKFKNCEYALY